VRYEEDTAPAGGSSSALSKAFAALTFISSRMDQRDAQAAAVRADVEEIGQLAHLIDLDVEARLAAARGSFASSSALRVGRRRQGSGSRRRKSGWLPPVYQRQPSQAPQGLRAVSCFAKKELGDLLGERQLADALRAMNQQRVRQPPGPTLSDSSSARSRVHQRSASGFLRLAHARPLRSRR